MCVFIHKILVENVFEPSLISPLQTVLHGPFETDTEQYAMTSSDHFRQASAAGGAAVGEASALHGSSSMQTAASSGGHVRADGGEVSAFEKAELCGTRSTSFPV